MIAAITGIGWVTPASMGSGRHYQTLQPKDGKLPKLTSRMIFGKVSPHFGRLDEYSKLGLTAVAFALKDAKQDEGNEKRPAGIIVSTVHGCLATDMDYFETVITYGGNLASPNLFACTLPNIFLGEAAIRFGLTGPGFAVNEPQLKGVHGLAMALCSMSLNDCRTMLVGTCDPGRPEFFPYNTEVTPGALFFVLEKHPVEAPLSYGGIDMITEGDILFKGTGVQSLEELFGKILEDL
jgi:3-oxoacyl-[acyl-carrier-protein] synthase II